MSRQPALPPSERHRQRPRSSSQPETGPFVIRLGRKCPEVPARIECVNGMWFATINGAACGRAHSDPFKAAGIDKVWLGRRISETEYLRLLALKDIPGHPNATPDRPIDLSKDMP